jgi:hypothetical protein
MYRLWKATPELFTSFAKIPSACRDLTNFEIDSGVPDTVTLSALLWQAGTISGGQRVFVSSHVRPKMKIHIFLYAPLHLSLLKIQQNKDKINERTIMKH